MCIGIHPDTLVHLKKVSCCYGMISFQTCLVIQDARISVDLLSVHPTSALSAIRIDQAPWLDDVLALRGCFGMYGNREAGDMVGSGRESGVTHILVRTKVCRGTYGNATQKVMERFAVNTLFPFRECKHTMDADPRVVIMPLKATYNASELCRWAREIGLESQVSLQTCIIKW